MTTPATPCPACGAPAAGNFCSSCGATLSARTCAACRAELFAQARFCHRCGQPVGGSASARSDRTAWLAAGAACLVLVGAIVYKVAGADPPPVADMANSGAAAPAGAPAATAPSAPDISRMTPRERFDRLFNRIMAAAEQGDSAQVERFTPMALGAYSQLDTVNADARYHAAVLYLQAGSTAPALALADTILSESPGHLFGYIIRGTAARVRNDDTARRQAQREFLARYEAEMKANRPEYNDHRPVIDEFRADVP